MKINILLIAIAIIVLFSCQNESNKILISGKVVGDIPKSIEYTSSIDGVCEPWFRETVVPDSSGNFQISIESEKPIFVFVLILPEGAEGIVVAEPGKSYEVVLEEDQGEYSFSVLGKENILHELYNRLDYPNHIQDASIEFDRDTVALAIRDTINHRRNNEITEFDYLLAKKLISNEVYNLIKTDRMVYYDALISNVAWGKYITLLKRGKKTEFPKDFDDLWKEVFENPLFSNPNTIYSRWTNFYTEEYMEFKKYLSGKYTLEKLKEIFYSNQTLKDQVSIAKEYVPREYQEAYIAKYLRQELAQESMDKAFIELYSNFKTDYPSSGYNTYISPFVDDVIKLWDVSDMSFSDNINFLQYDGTNTFSQVVGSMKSELIYVVVWTTWEPKCRDDFRHNKELVELLEEYNIPILYISTDYQRDPELWENMIKFYDLKGHHIRTNEKLNSEMENITLRYPRYLLANRKGDIIKYASPPSKLKMLEEEIN